jgi:hypothetical protein
MGSSTSVMATATTHKQALSETEFTRSVMDQILNYMIKQLSIRDLLQMSKPSECKKYVLFKANSIYQYFYELRIFPSKDAKGLLTFRKVDDLVNPKGEQEKERQSLCLIVAYFYTRIFQIYGALALTLIDDMNAMTSSGIMTLPLGSDARLRTPGYFPQNVNYDPTRRGVGGASNLLDPDYDGRRDDRPRYESSKDTRESLKNFKWIRSFLTSEYTSNLGFKTRFVGTSSNRGVVYLKLEDELKDRDRRIISSYGNPPLESYQSATFYIGISGMSKYATLDLYTRIAPDETKVKTQKLSFINQYDESVVTEQFEKTFSVDTKQVNGKTTYVIKNMDVSEYLANYFSEIIQYLKDAIRVHKNANSSSRALSTTRRSEEGISEHLRLEKMIDDLTTRKPLGHCIARALQLLKAEPFDKEVGITQICSATFAENKRMGVVKQGSPLSDSPGLFALANLFYDTITIGSPNLSIGTERIDGKPSSMEQYVAFMTSLSKMYALDDTPHTGEEYEKKGLAGIINKRDQIDCKGITAALPLSNTTTKKVHDIVKTMFQDQVNHAAKCFKIINMLFKITYENTSDGKKRIKLLNLSDGLITKGFPELYRINREVRELLVSYYTNCENKYKMGMQLVLNEQKAEKNALEAKIAAENAKIKAKVEAEVKAKVEAEAKVKAEAEAKAKAEERKKIENAKKINEQKLLNAAQRQKIEAAIRAEKEKVEAARKKATDLLQKRTPTGL